jgi:hypothetical protein
MGNDTIQTDHFGEGFIVMQWIKISGRTGIPNQMCPVNGACRVTGHRIANFNIVIIYCH